MNHYYLVEAVFSNVKSFKTIIETTCELSNDAVFFFTEQGIKFQAMDASHCSLCSMNFDMEDFVTYICEQETQLGMSFTNLNKILKCASLNDTVTIKADTDHKFTIEIRDPKQEKQMCFEMNTMDIDQDRLEAPEEQYPFTCKIPSDRLKQVINDSFNIGEVCTLRAQDQKLIFTVQGEIGSLKIELSVPGSSVHVGDTGFSSKFLHSIMKAYTLNEHVTVSFDKDKPILFTFPFGVKSYYKYYLAPKIKD